MISAFKRPLLFPMLLGVVVFLTGINWGLPSRNVDPFLFRTHPVWTGREIMKLAGATDDANRGADVASHSAVDRSAPVVLNATDEDRARIVRRYRLMSYQPDEWNTLKALSEMKPGRADFDPKLYQYGGLWVYPVGAMLKAAAMLHLIELHSDVAWYLDHPEAFGRFYIVARLWSVLWGMVGIAVVYALVRRIVGGWIFPMTAAICFVFMPVVVNMAHEAKPHLAGAVLTLLAVLAASHYVEYGTRRAWVRAGVLCGAALGMVLTTLPVFLVLPMMVLMRTSSWREKAIVCAGAIGVGVTVYLLTNPYVPINFLFHRGVLVSNLGNSSAMYHAKLTGEGILNAIYLIVAGTSPLLAIVGTAGAIGLGLRAVYVRGRQDDAEIRRRATGILLAVPALCMVGQSMLFATGKPGEFGRFMLLTDVFLMIEAIVGVATFLGNRGSSNAVATLESAAWASPETLTQRAQRREDAKKTRPFLCVFASLRPLRSSRSADPTHPVNCCRNGSATSPLVFLIVLTAIPGLAYVRGFARDSRSDSSRLAAAEKLRDLNPAGTRTVALDAEPAPYCLPPVDLFDGKVLLLPIGAGRDRTAAMTPISVHVIGVAEDESLAAKLLRCEVETPISWADKRFEVER